jgi:hypothetical protein
MTFGIPIASVNLEGPLKAEVYEQHVQERLKKEFEWRLREEEGRPKDCIAYPRTTDVVLGRGRPYQDYSGNQRLARTIDSYREQYSQANDTFEKTCITMNVVKRIHELKGRFLQRTSDGWKEASDDVARAKVSQAFRTKPTRSKVSPSDSPPPSEKTFGSPQAKRIRYVTDAGDEEDWISSIRSVDEFLQSQTHTL